MARFLNSKQIYVETVTILAAGTAQQATSVPVPDGVSVLYRAHPDNTGYIKIADTAAKAQASTGAGNVPLANSEGVTYQITNPSIPYIDATVSGEKVVVTMEY